MGRGVGKALIYETDDEMRRLILFFLLAVFPYSFFIGAGNDNPRRFLFMYLGLPEDGKEEAQRIPTLDTVGETARPR